MFVLIVAGTIMQFHFAVFTIFPGNISCLLKYNFVQLSPKNRHLMKQEHTVSNELKAAGRCTEDLKIKIFYGFSKHPHQHLQQL